jgi:D-amino-acid dehydrogenase
VKFIIVGSGLIGVTTAYYLRERSHQVVVIDREEGPGRDTSFANGSLLTAGMADPWNTPGCWRALLASLGRSDAVLQLRLSALPSLTGWGIRFLRNARSETFERNVLSNLHLALYSLKRMRSLCDETGIEYGRSARGSLKIFRDERAWDHATAIAERRVSEGLQFQRLSTAQTLDIEPALAPIVDRLVGSLHYIDDETGDAHRFCVALAKYAQGHGVEFHFRTSVSSLEIRSGQVAAVIAGEARFVADRYIVAAGSYSTPLLGAVGIHVPVQPAKGYSLTAETLDSQATLRLPVIDDDLHAAVVPMEGTIRVAGTAEFAGYDRSVDPARVRKLENLLREILPRESYDLKAATSWCGLRAMSADGVPIIGPTKVANLYVNTGHGHLGWTMAAGSGQLLAELISGEPPSIEPHPYAPARFFA